MFSSNTFGGSSFGSSSNTGFGSGGFGNNNNNTNNTGNTGMFGSNNNTGGGFGSTGGFGGTPNNNTGGGFGSNTNAFGTNNNNTGGFGSSTFGSTSNNTGGFGSSTPNTGFGSNNTGGFGNTNTNTGFGASNTGFGSTSTPTTTGFGGGGGFGNTGTPNTGFGNTNSFGAGSTSTGTGNPPWQVTLGDHSLGDNSNEKYQSITMMSQYSSKSFEELRLEDYANGFKPGGAGAATPAGATGGSFGANTNTGFASNTTGSTFGAAPASTNNAFGSTNTGAFGSTMGNNNTGGGLFSGAPNSSPSTFGSNNNTNTGGLFGNNNTNTGGGLFGNNNNSNNATGGGLFGNNNNASGGGMFGNNNANNNNTAGGGLFGGNKTGAFGSTTGGAFGSTPNNNAGGGLFGGAPNASPSTFGTNTNTGGGLFGNNNNNSNAGGGGLFGNNTNNTGGGGLFGNNNNNNNNGGGLFGNNNNSSNTGGGLFGNSNASTNTSGGLFGNNNTAASGGSSLFGNSNNNKSGGLFGNTSNTGGSSLFGNNNKPAGSAFGAPASGSLFGNAPTNTTSVFGSNNNSSGGLFGKPATTGGFGGAPNSGGLFGNNPATNANQAAPGAAQPVQLAMVAPAPYATGNMSQMARHVMLAQDAWKPVPNKEPDSSKLSKKSSKPSSGPTLPRESLGQSVRYRGRGYGSLVALNNSKSQSDALVLHSASKATNRLNGSGAQSSQEVAGILSPGVFDLNKRLSIRKTGRKPVAPSPMLEITEKNNQNTGSVSSEHRVTAEGASSTKKQLFTDRESPSPIPMKNLSDLDDEAPLKNKSDDIQTRRSGPKSLQQSSSSQEDAEEDNGFVVVGRSSPRRDWSHGTAPDAGDSIEPVSKHCPVLSEEYVKLGYEVNPPMKTLKEMTDEELQKVPSFTVKRSGHGAVKWFGVVDVRDLVIHEVVEIDGQSIEVYKDGKGTPERGTGLNRPALCTVENIAMPPSFKSTPERFIAILEKLNVQQDANFIDYDVTTRTWTFKVQHFTKYGFVDFEALANVENTSTAAATSDVSDNQVCGSASGIQEPTSSRIDKSNSLRSPQPFHASPLVIQNSRTASELSPFANARSPRFVAAAGPKTRPLNSSMQRSPREVADAQMDVHEEVDYQVSKDESVHSHAPLGASRAFRLFQDAMKECESEGNNIPTRVRRPMCLNRSFRVSWGPNGELVHCGNPVNGSENPEVFRNVVVERVNSTITPDELEPQLVQHSLARKTRKLTKVEASLEGDDDMMDEADSNDHWTLLLHSYISLTKAQLSKAGSPNAARLNHLLHVWTLVNAIWGETILNLPEVPTLEHLQEASSHLNTCAPLPDEGTVNPEVYEPIVLPKLQSECVGDTLHKEALESVNIWLREVIREVDQRLPVSGELAHDQPGWEVAAGRIERACETAIQQGNFRLATLLSQATGDTKVRQLLHEQLQVWEAGENLAHLDRNVLDAYCTIAGAISPRQASDSSWLRGFALHLWHRSPPLTPLRRAVSSFRVSLNQRGEGSTRTFPLPWYLGDGAIEENPALDTRMESWGTGLDTLFHLLCLAADGDVYKVLDTLEPVGHTPDVLDYSLAWHLGEMLQGLELAGLLGQPLTQAQAQAIHMSFVFQLEAAGMWHWAVYVAHQLPAPQCDAVVSEILHRHCTPLVLGVARGADRLEWQLEFVQDVVGVPSSAIAAARSCRARYASDPALELSYSANARDWDTFHELLTSKLGPRTVVDGQTEMILKVLEDARQLQLDTESFSDWPIKGGLYEKFAKLKQMQRELPDASLLYDSDEALKFLQRFDEELFIFGQNLIMRHDMRSANSDDSEASIVEQQGLEEMGSWVHYAWLQYSEYLDPERVTVQIDILPRIPSRFDVHQRTLNRLVKQYAANQFSIEQSMTLAM